MAIPVNKGNAGSVETQIYNYVIGTLKYNEAIACGILANAEAESSFNPAAVGDGGSAYGLFQWNSRREALFSHAGTRTPSVAQQLDFMKYELETTEKATAQSLKSIENTAEGAKQAGNIFCIKFERPSDKYNKGEYRGNLAKNKYWSAYSSSPNAVTKTSETLDLGPTMLSVARSCVGKLFQYDQFGPYTFSNSGFEYYTLNQSLNSLGQRVGANAEEVWGKPSAGDVIYMIPKIENEKYSIGIATGNGYDYYGFVYDSSLEVGDLRPDAPYRISLITFRRGQSGYDIVKTLRYSVDLSSGNSGESPSPDSGNGSNDSDSSSTNPTYNAILLAGAQYSEDTDRYLKLMLEAREYINSKEAQYAHHTLTGGASSLFYGYLIDLTNGGEFKFIVPEHDENIRVNWDSVSILGRSAEVKGYNSTSAKSISVDLELILGTGIYIGKNKVNEFYNDIAFLESLGYPDYSKAMVFPPPTVYLYLNPMTQIRGVIEDVSVKYKKPFDYANRPMYATVSFTVSQVSSNPPDYADIRYRRDNSY